MHWIHLLKWMNWSLYLFTCHLSIFICLSKGWTVVQEGEKTCVKCVISRCWGEWLYMANLNSIVWYGVVRRAWGEWLLTFLHKRVVKIDVNVTCNCGQNICKCLTFLLCAYKQQKRDCVKHISLLWALLNELFWPCVNICMACNSLLWHTFTTLGKKEKLRGTTFNGIFCWHYVAAHR